MLYRKGKLPEKLRMKKPAKGSIVRYKKHLTIDPSTIKIQEMSKVNTHKAQKNDVVQFETKNNDLEIVSQGRENLETTPNLSPVPKDKPVSKIKAVVVTKRQAKK